MEVADCASHCIWGPSDPEVGPDGIVVEFIAKCYYRQAILFLCDLGEPSRVLEISLRRFVLGFSRGD